MHKQVPDKNQASTKNFTSKKNKIVTKTHSTKNKQQPVEITLQQKHDLHRHIVVVVVSSPVTKRTTLRTRMQNCNTRGASSPASTKLS